MPNSECFQMKGDQQPPLTNTVSVIILNNGDSINTTTK